MAPRLMRFPDTPNIFIIPNANNKESGITDATTNPALKFPNKSNKINITISPPSIRFVVTVPIARFTRSLLSRYGSITTPSGKVF